MHKKINASAQKPVNIGIKRRYAPFPPSGEVRDAPPLGIYNNFPDGMVAPTVASGELVSHVWLLYLAFVALKFDPRYFDEASIAGKARRSCWRNSLNEFWCLSLQ